jgi:hypothetical protein
MLCERNKHPVQKMVKLRAPAGVTHVYTMTGQQVAVRDGMVEVSEENRGPLMTVGFILINGEYGRGADATRLSFPGK